MVRSRGLDLTLAEWGDVGSARVVLVGAHGFLDCGEFFAPLAAAFAAASAPVALAALSFAGHGRSARADAYGWFDHTADLLAAARAVAERAAGRASLGLIGHSFGGVQVLQALTLEPDAADFAVNLDAMAAPSPLEGGGMTTALAYLAAAGEDLRPLPSYARLHDIVARRARSNPRLAPRLLRWLAPHLASRSGGRYWWRVDPALVGWVRPWDLSGSPAADPLALAAALPHPVLAVTGAAPDHPQIRGPYPGDEAIAGLGRLTHVRLSGAGHYVHLECPDQVAAAVTAHAGLVVREVAR